MPQHRLAAEDAEEDGQRAELILMDESRMPLLERGKTHENWVGKKSSD